MTEATATLNVDLTDAAAAVAEFDAWKAAGKPAPEFTPAAAAEHLKVGKTWKQVAQHYGMKRGTLRSRMLKAGYGCEGKEAAAIDVPAIRAIVQEEMAKGRPAAQVIEVRAPDGTVRPVEGKTHAEFGKVLMLAAARRNVLLVGPAGTGKTHLAHQVALALGLPFGFIACSAGMSEGQLLGRLVPTGESGRFEYLRSEFVKCYEEGGVFLFDEVDAADANTLLVLNAALANGHMAVPNRPGNPVATKHPDFICVAAANTFGTGASRQYVGRSQLDESTLDRFRIGQIEIDYDADVEAALCPDADLRARLQGYRAAARAAGLRRIVSMRFLRDAHLMKSVGFTDADVDGALFRGWSADEIAKVK